MPRTNYGVYSPVGFSMHMHRRSHWEAHTWISAPFAELQSPIVSWPLTNASANFSTADSRRKDDTPEPLLSVPKEVQGLCAYIHG